MTIGTKLTLGFSLVLLPMVVALIVGLSGFQTDVDTYAGVLVEGEALFDRVIESRAEYETLVQQIQASQELAAASNFSLRAVMITMAAVAIALGVVALVVLIKGISQPVRQTVEAAGRLADGDLSLDDLPVRSSDEIGELTLAFNRVIANLRGFMVNVQNAGESVVTGGQALLEKSSEATATSGQIAAAMEQVAEGTTRQLSEIDGTQKVVERLRKAVRRIVSGADNQKQRVERAAAAVKSMTEGVGRVVTSVQELAAVAGNSDEVARAGSVAVSEVAGGVTEMRGLAAHLAERMEELAAFSQDMDEVMQMTHALADQSQLVSLAATGASRIEGERPNITVIVEEVGRLAERAVEGKVQIKQRIVKVQAAVVSAAEAVQAKVALVESGAGLAGNARGVLADMVDATGEAKQLSQAISDAIQAVADRNREVTEAISLLTGVDDVAEATAEVIALSDRLDQALQAVSTASKETASATEEVATSVGQIREVGTEMHGSITSFIETTDKLAQLTQQFQLKVVEEEVAEETASAEDMAEKVAEAAGNTNPN